MQSIMYEEDGQVVDPRTKFTTISTNANSTIFGTISELMDPQTEISFQRSRELSSLIHDLLSYRQ